MNNSSVEHVHVNCFQTKKSQFFWAIIIFGLHQYDKQNEKKTPL